MAEEPEIRDAWDGMGFYLSEEETALLQRLRAALPDEDFVALGKLLLSLVFEPRPMEEMHVGSS